VEFRVLGPLEIWEGSRRLELGGARQQIVIATLLLSANRVVSVGRLVEAVYGSDLPETARLQVQISISSLRRLLAPHGRAAAIATRANGYEVQVGDGELDSQRFAQLVVAGAAAKEAGQLSQAVSCYRDALRLWRGPALDGIDSQVVQAAALRLDEQRISVNEERLAVELDLGRHHELVGELTELAAEFPLRERLRGQLMLALHRCGRTAEALQVYRETRRTLVDELGIEPGEQLRRLEHAILTRDPSLDPPAQPGPVQAGPAQPASAQAGPAQPASALSGPPESGPPESGSVQPGPAQLLSEQVPRMLPAGIADFTGRAEEISEVRRHLLLIGQEAHGAVPVVVITGRGGIGKTSLAVHVSHGLDGRFTDGQLFADLHGGGPHPPGPLAILARFLRALGVPGSQLPEGLDERAEMYRSRLAGRKVLVVLDDAASESQVTPLLPGSQTTAVIVTSRSRLGGLAGAARVEVGALDVGRSMELLARIAGEQRVLAQPAEAAAVAARCGHLPLALRVAGARLAARPHWSIGQLAGRLADETRRLDELRHGDLAVRPSISLSYDNSSEPARRLMRRLALMDQPVFSGWLAAALLDGAAEDAEDLLDELVSAQLIETTVSGSGRYSQYRFHDLIREFAREQLTTEDDQAEQKAAVERALGALLYLAEEAHRVFFGHEVWIASDAPRWPLPGQLTEKLIGDPMGWYEAERAALIAGVRQAAREGLAETCWGLAFSAIPLFESRAYLDDWRETHDTALAAVRAANSVRGEAAILLSLAELHLTLKRPGPGRQEATAASRLFAQVGDDHSQALAERHVAYADWLSGRLDDAMRRYERALRTLREVGDDAAATFVLQAMARVELERGEPAAARQLITQALQMSEGDRSGRFRAQVLYRVGEISLLAGELSGAVDAFGSALLLVRGSGDLIGEAYALAGMGSAKVRQGQTDQASEALTRAAELAVISGDRLAEIRALSGLTEVALASDDPGQAIANAERAVSVAEQIGAPLEQSRALTQLSDAYAARGDAEAASTAAARAAAIRANLTAVPA
jgi:DNA-binding SARP family transcriptional activator/tetratricopeptide (TPR) repeat protein